MPTVEHRKFDLGVNLDEAGFLLPEGFVASSMNMIFDKIGIVRKRGGITGFGPLNTYNGDNIGSLIKDDGTQQLFSKGSFGGTANIAALSAGGVLSGGLTVMGDVITDGGRPFQHYGWLVYPQYGNNPAAGILQVAPTGLAGASPSSGFTFGTPASVVMTAGDKRITCAAGDNPLVNLTVGQTITIQYGAAFQNFYTGRVTRLVSTTAFEVFPTPVSSNAGAAAGCVVKTRGYANSFDSVPFPAQFVPHYIGCKVGMSFQGRMVLGNLSTYNAGAFGRIDINPRGVAFSTVLLEQPLIPVVSAPPNEMTGATWFMNDGWPALNTFNIPAQEAITAMSPTGFGDAVIFSAFRTFRLTGNLTTQWGTEQSITWAVREIPNSVGCITERSMQRTPRGIIFAHDSGIYTTDGQSMQPLTYRRITNEWLRLVRGTGFKIYGSALIRGNHYYICGISNGELWAWMVNLDTLAWQEVAGKTSIPASWIINSSVVDGVDPSRTWGLKWWNQSGAAPSMTGGQLVALDTIFVPTSANRSDSDGTVVNFEVKTKPYTDDSPAIQKNWEKATVVYKNIGGSGVSVTPQDWLDASEVDPGGSFFYLPRQDPYVVTAGTGAGVGPIVLTIGAGHNIKQDSWVRVINVGGNTAANGPWRVQAVTGTTVTLMGSVGNGAYTSGGQVQQTDDRDMPLNLMSRSLGTNDAAVSYRINDTDDATNLGADEFELYSILHTYEPLEPHSG